MYMNIYIYICICIYTYMYMYICICPHTCGPCVTEIANAKTRDSGFTINSRASGMSASASRHRTICTKFTTAQYLIIIYYARTRL